MLYQQAVQKTSTRGVRDCCFGPCHVVPLPGAAPDFYFHASMSRNQLPHRPARGDRSSREQAHSFWQFKVIRPPSSFPLMLKSRAISARSLPTLLVAYRRTAPPSLQSRTQPSGPIHRIRPPGWCASTKAARSRPGPK